MHKKPKKDKGWGNFFENRRVFRSISRKHASFLQIMIKRAAC